MLSLGARAALLPATRAVAEGALLEGDIPRGSFVLGFLAGFFGGCLALALALALALVFAIAKGSQTKQGAGMKCSAQVILGIVLDGIRR